MGWGLRRRVEEASASYPLLRRIMVTAYIFRTDVLSRKDCHPLDRAYRVRTQRHIPLYLTKTGSPVDGEVIPYGGCVASAVRRVLNRLSPVEGSTFIDLGCGKGRALIIATEHPFARIIGVELNAQIAAVARANARRVARRFPERTAIEVRVGDASLPVLPNGDTVVFLYHPFGETLVSRLCEYLHRSAGPGRSITVVYENPVHGAIFDAHPGFMRQYAAMVRCEDDEAAFAFDAEEAIVVWRSISSAVAPDAGAGRPIVTVKPGYRAILTRDDDARSFDGASTPHA